MEAPLNGRVFGRACLGSFDPALVPEAPFGLIKKDSTEGRMLGSGDEAGSPSLLMGSNSQSCAPDMFEDSKLNPCEASSIRQTASVSMRSNTEAQCLRSAYLSDLEQRIASAWRIAS